MTTDERIRMYSRKLAREVYKRTPEGQADLKRFAQELEELELEFARDREEQRKWEEQRKLE